MHAHWRRLLDRVTDPETNVLLTFIDEAGRERLFRGCVQSTSDPRGPSVGSRDLVMFLCPWDRLRAVECLTPAETVEARLVAAERVAEEG